MWVSTWLLFFIGHLCLIGMWFGEDQKIQHHKDTCLKEIGPQFQNCINYSILNNNEHNWEGPYVTIQSRITNTRTSIKNVTR
jgi:hypothetical protein